MGSLDGRVAIITGAGRGLGRAYARFFAAEGAKVVVNDNGCDPSGERPADDAAGRVVAEIREAGGEAVVSREDVADWEAGGRLVQTAVDAFGRLDVLVNNAGILRDRAIVNMEEGDWDEVIRVHLKGHFVPLRHAASHWRARAKAGEEVRASVVNTSSTSGLQGNPGQSNYGAAKAGVAALTVIAAMELARYGVRVNGVVPTARTRLTESTPGLDEIVRPPEDASRFDEWDPDNVSPVVGWLAREGCTVTGRLLYVFGGTVQPMTGWLREPGLGRPERWTLAELDEQLGPLLG
ncbi:MAG TPA: SDR family oxidoreductase [Acidimicrobiales bacterium]|nr:SDR family oxidoreductase [Acidimicrobiales bacterium]